MTVGVDSCAAASVLPASFLPHVPVIKDAKVGTSYIAANGNKMPDYGRKHVFGRFEGAEAIKGLKFRVTDVKRPLMSVAAILDNGHTVVFARNPDGSSNSRIECSDGTEIRITEDKKTFSVKFDPTGPPPPPSPPTGFQRRGAGP